MSLKSTPDASVPILMNTEQTTYTERSPWPGFATAILWGVVVLSCYPILAGWDTDLPVAARWAIVLSVVAFVVALQATVQETRIFIHLGRVPLIRKSVPYGEILSLESVTYHPIREFGGWGVRGLGKRRAWTARGNRALRLELTGDRVLLVGSDHPRRLEERVRATAGDQLGRKSA